MTTLRKVVGTTLAGAGLASYAYMQTQPHQILSPLQFFFKNRGMVLFPTSETPHYQVLTGRESMSLYIGGL